ncbi:MAG: hypothetical protein ACP5OV_00065 [Acidimicrobiales bacterium]
MVVLLGALAAGLIVASLLVLAALAGSAALASARTLRAARDDRRRANELDAFLAAVLAPAPARPPHRADIA